MGEQRRESAMACKCPISSIKQILPPRLVRTAQIADDLAIDMKIVGLGPLHQSQTRFLGGAIALAVVAGPATRNQVVPGGIAAATPGNDVVKRQVQRWKDVPAVLAGVVIAQQDVFAREALSLERNVNVLEQPYYRRRRHRKTSRVQPR